MENGKQYIFVCGAPRSGTTALASLISTLENTHIGQEVFPDAVKIPDPTRLTYSFFDRPILSKRLSRKHPPKEVEKLLKKYATSKVVGDKHPHYHRHLNNLAEEFPGCHFVFIYRDINEVARSFQRRFENPDDKWGLRSYHAAHYWCDAAENFLNYSDKNPKDAASYLLTTSFQMGAHRALPTRKSCASH